MKSVLITGANKGIGLETAKQLSKKGLFIYLGTRDCLFYNVLFSLPAFQSLPIGFNKMKCR